MASDSPSPAAFAPCEIALITWSGLPGGTPDDQPLFEALTRRGRDVRFVDWSDPEADWSQVGMAVLRSPWDFFKRVDEFIAFLDAASFQTRVVNPAPVARWNIDKRYLSQFAARDVRIASTVFVGCGENRTLQDVCDYEGWNDVVVKPRISGGAFRTARFSGAAIAAEGEQHLADLTAERDAMVQVYLRGVEFERERSLMFIAGRYSHSVLRSAFNPGGQHAEEPFAVSDEEIAFGHEVLKAGRAITGEAFAYARVDLLPDAEGPMLLELEVTEPSMFFIHRPQAAEELAEVLAAQV